MDKELNYKLIKKSFVFLFLLLAIPIVLSAEQSIFSGEVNSGETVDVEGNPLTVDIAGGTVFVEYLGLSFLIEGIDCQTQSTIQVCVLATEGSFSADISVSAEVAELDIEKKIKENKDTFVLGEVFNVKVNMTNTGDRSITYLKIKEDLKDFEILDVTGTCELFGTLALKETSLGVNSKTECNYKLRAINPGDFELETEITFFNGYENKTETVTEDIEVVEYTLKLNYTLDDLYSIGETTELEFNLTNTYPDKVNVRELLLETEGLEVVNSTLKTRDNSEIDRWSGEIAGNGSFAYKVQLKIISSANKLITKIRFSPTSGTLEKNFSLSLPMLVNNPQIKLKEITDNSIIISVENPNFLIGFKNINITVNLPTNNLTINRIIESLDKNEKQEISIEVALVKRENGSTPVLFSGQYETENNELITFNAIDYVRTNGTIENQNTTESQSNETIEENKESDPSSKIKSWAKYAGIGVGALIIIVILFVVSIKLIRKKKAESVNTEEK